MAGDTGGRDEIAPRHDQPDPLERISDADRERAVELVRTALGDGRLALDELDDRLGSVIAARTRADLETALAHLPGADVAAQPVTSAARRDQPTVIEGSHTTVQRTGRWEVPAHLIVKVKHSSVTLDLMEAVLPGPEVLVEVDLSHSRVDVVVADDIRVETSDIEQKGSSLHTRPIGDPAITPRAVVRLTGRAHWSNVTATGPGWRRPRGRRKGVRRRR